jgi:hypothetical protein
MSSRQRSKLMTQTDEARCQAAHQDDPRPCEGPHDAVIIQVDTKVSACVLHGAVMLASIKGAKVYPGSVESSAIEAFNRAQSMKPFDFLK